MIMKSAVWFAIALLMLLTACSELQTYSNAGFAPVVSRGYGVNFWLKEMYETRSMSSDELKNTLKVWEQEYKDNPDLNNRMRLALLLAAGSESVRDQRRASNLLDDVDLGLYKTNDKEMVLLLRQFLDEQSESGRKISILWKQVTEQNIRIEELEQQQKALTTIEQSIQQREKSPGIDNGD